MAKALVGYSVAPDPRAASIELQNRRLRARIADLEAIVVRLSQENDALVERLRAADDVLEPA